MNVPRRTDQDSPRLDRRQALAAGIGAVVGLGCSSFGSPAPAAAAGFASEDNSSMFPIVDTHVHLWDLSKLRLPWLSGSPTLNRSFLWDDYLAASKGVTVEKAVYMEVDAEPTQQTEEARSIIELGRSGKTALKGAVISGRPASDGFAAYLDQFRDEPFIKGVRQVLHGPSTPRGYCLDPAFIRGIQLLGKRGLSYDLCLRPDENGDAVRLVDACPETTFILDHCGNAEVFASDRSGWRSDVARLAERTNVNAKVSGIIASTKGKPWTPDDLAPIVNHVIDSFGPDRVVFGGDWPVCTLGAPLLDWIRALRTIVANRPEDDRHKLFHDNAVRIYRLS
jgi:L-fuconolactonase